MFQHALIITTNIRGDLPVPGPREDPCLNHPQQTDVDFVGTVWYKLIKGALHQVSEPECPPGTIGHSYSYSTSWSISGQIGPDMVRLNDARFRRYPTLARTLFSMTTDLVR